MKKLLFLLVFLGTTGVVLGQQTIRGTLSDTFAPLPFGTIQNLSQNTSVKTENDGSYSIEAFVGDRIEFSFPGKRSLVFTVEDTTKILNVQLEDEITALDNVVVTRQGQKTLKELYKEYNSNPNIVKTIFGYLDAEAASFPIRMMNETNMVQAGGDLATMIRGRFPGVRINNDDLGTPQIFLRETASFTAVPAGYDIDNVLYDTYPTWLDANSVFRIAIIPSRAANTRYGSFGAGGMIIINTMNSNVHPVGEDGKPIDLALVDDNKFNETVLSPEQVLKTRTPQSQLIASFEHSLDLIAFLKERSDVLNSYDLLTGLDKVYQLASAADFEFFVDHYLARFSSNAPALKALGYYLQSIGESTRALESFKQVLKLRSNYLQSYLDLADSYEALKQYNKSLSLYVRAQNLVKSGFIVGSEASSTLLSFDRSFDSFLKRHQGEFEAIALDFESAEPGTEITVYFDETETEFELYFVNPEKRYFKTTYSTASDLDLINQNKSLGLTALEFFIDSNLRGKWDVYVRYLGNKKETPSAIQVVSRSTYPTPQGAQKPSPSYLFSILTAKDQLVHLGSLMN